MRKKVLKVPLLLLRRRRRRRRVTGVRKVKLTRIVRNERFDQIIRNSIGHRIKRLTEHFTIVKLYLFTY